MAASSNSSFSADKDTVSHFSTDELSDYLLDRVSDNLVLKLREQKLCGMDFLNLNADQLKELFPMMGERMLISRIIKELTKEKSGTLQTVRLVPPTYIACTQ